MKRLVNVNREGGYPLTGEALEILAKDMPEYINAILDDIVPENSIVFLNDRYAYVKTPNRSEIMEVHFNGITKQQILSGSHFAITVSSPGYNDIVNGQTYTYTRDNISVGITSSSSTSTLKAYTLDSLLKEKYVVQQDDLFNLIQAAHNGGRTLQMAGSAIISTNPTTNKKFADIDLVFKYPANNNTEDSSLTVILPNDFLTPTPIFVECYCNKTGTKPDAIMDASEITIQAPGYAGNNQYVTIHLVMHYQLVGDHDNWRMSTN